MLHHVHSRLIYNSQKLERAQMSHNGRMDTEIVVHLHNGIRNNDFTKFLGKWMDLENIILSEVTKSQKNRHNMQSQIIGYLPPGSSQYPRSNSLTI